MFACQRRLVGRQVKARSYNDKHKMNARVRQLNSIFYESVPIISGEELNQIIKNKFGRPYKPVIYDAEGAAKAVQRKHMKILHEEEHDIIYFNRIAEIINIIGAAHHVKHNIENLDIVIKAKADGSYCDFSL